MRNTVGIRSGLCYRPERDVELLSKYVALKVACKRKQRRHNEAEPVHSLTACSYDRWRYQATVCGLPDSERAHAAQPH